MKISGDEVDSHEEEKHEEVEEEMSEEESEEEDLDEEIGLNEILKEMGYGDEDYLKVKKKMILKKKLKKVTNLKKLKAELGSETFLLSKNLNLLSTKLIY